MLALGLFFSLLLLTPWHLVCSMNHLSACCYSLLAGCVSTLIPFFCIFQQSFSGFLLVLVTSYLTRYLFLYLLGVLGFSNIFFHVFLRVCSLTHWTNVVNGCFVNYFVDVTDLWSDHCIHEAVSRLEQSMQ